MKPSQDTMQKIMVSSLLTIIFYFSTAITSISILPFKGRAATWKADLAGNTSLNCSAYILLTSAKSAMSFSKTNVFTT